MELAQWASMSRDQQRRQILDFHEADKWEEYEELALRAADTLENELRTHPEVTSVQVEGVATLGVAKEIVSIPELGLHVCTLLSESARLDYLPTSFAGFRVRQLNLGDKRESFLRTWKRLFQELMGWDEKTTLKWAEKWEEALSGRRPSAIYHYGPVKRPFPVWWMTGRRQRQAIDCRYSTER